MSIEVTCARPSTDSTRVKRAARRDGTVVKDGGVWNVRAAQAE
jgi:hypothetical protein